MKLDDKSAQNKALIFATLLALIFSIWFLRGYFSMFVVAGTLAYLFNPLFKKFNKKFTKNTAVVLTVLSSFLIIITPLTLTLYFSGLQLSRVSQSVSPYFSNLDTNSIMHYSVNTINDFTKHLPFQVSSLNTEALSNSLKNLIISAGNILLSSLTGILGSFISIFTNFIIFIFVFVSLLKNGEYLLKLFKKINPLGKELSELYIIKVGAMIRGTVLGQFVIAITQGILGALAFAIAGYGNFFFVIFTVFTLLSIIPLGAGILAIPAGILMIIFGNFWGGLIVVLEHILVNTNVDNILRPILVPKTAKLDPALMLVSVFAGIGIFGFLGIIIGPTLMILIVTTINAYTEYVTKQDFPKSKSKIELASSK